MTALIIAGGVLLDPEKIAEKVDFLEFDLIIACDSGYDNAKQMSVKPQYVVGDLDSIKSQITDAKVIKLKPEKDDTDLRVAINFAIEKGAKTITILCATGGRLDHFYGNMSNLEYLDTCGIDGNIIDEKNTITINSKGTKKYKNISKYISVVPISDEIVVTLHNLKYKADRLVVKRQNIVSISNECEVDEFIVEVLEGKAYIIQSDN